MPLGVGILLISTVGVSETARLAVAFTVAVVSRDWVVFWRAEDGEKLIGENVINMIKLRSPRHDQPAK